MTGRPYNRRSGVTLRRACLIGSLSAFALFGCTGDGGGATPSSSSSTTERGSSTSSTDTTADPKAAAQTALDAYWAMVKRLGAAPNPDDPELQERAVDPILSSIRDLYATQQSQGQHSEYDGVPYRVELTVTSVDGDVATFEGCSVDGARLVGPGGEVVNDKVNTYRQRGTLVRVDGMWKLQRFDVLRQAEGEVPCDSLA